MTVLATLAEEQLSDDDIIASYPRPSQPHLRVNFVASLDGAVAVDGLSTGLSGAADKRVFRLLRMLCDGLLVGAGTLRDENYRALTLDETRRDWRREHGLAPYPRLVVVSESLRLDPQARAFAEAPIRPVVLTSRQAPAASRAALEPVADIIAADDLADGLARLRDLGLAQLLCEGGPTLFGALTAADLVDELCLTVSPVLAGPGSSRITAGPSHPPQRLSAAHAIVAADGSLLLRYQRKQAR